MKILWFTDFLIEEPKTGLEIPAYYLTEFLKNQHELDIANYKNKKEIVLKTDSRNIFIENKYDFNKIMSENKYECVIFDFLNRKEMLKMIDVFDKDTKKILYARDSLIVNAISKYSSGKFSLLTVIRYVVTALIHEFRSKYHRFDKVVFVNDRDEELSRKIFFWCKNFRTVKNGVHSNYFKSEIKSNNKKVALFVGPAKYLPNREAVRYIIEKIVPEFKKSKDIQFVVVGSNYDNFFNEVKNTNIVFKGFVENIIDEYNSADIFLAPIFLGSGIKNKTLEAMASGLAVLGSKESFSGIPINEKHGIVCSDENDFICGLRKLINNNGLCEEYGNNARNLMMKEFKWEIAGKRLMDIINESKNN